ncbi:hypothetical protein HGG76_26320 [Ochrobactrum tritici]|uniref:Uncharacterized protein n=1 Tax=Brucella tritici TaxID=94626 RepID=A0A7X6JBQ8_9HYPH|nr:hypothetical protein [Brucella tritici]
MVKTEELPSSFRHVRLVLARGKDHLEGIGKKAMIFWFRSTTKGSLIRSNGRNLATPVASDSSGTVRPPGSGCCGARG